MDFQVGLEGVSTQRFLSEFRGSPRFGYSNQFSDLFNDDKRDEYITGVLVSALIIMCFFICWGILMMIFKCMGKRRVGFLSGAPYDYKTKFGEQNKRPMRGRIVFGLSGLLFIIFTFLLLFLGFANLEETTDELADGASLTSQIFRDVLDVLQEFVLFLADGLDLLDQIVTTVWQAFELTNTTLPPGYNGTLAPDSAAVVTAAEFIVDGIDLGEGARQIAAFIEELKQSGFAEEQSDEVVRTLQGGESTFNDVSDGLDSVQLRALQIGFGLPLTTISFLMLVLMGLSTYGIDSKAKSCCTAWFMTPLFVFITSFIVIFSAAMSVAGIMNGDFCSGGKSSTPEETLLQILEYRKVDFSSFKYKASDYVIHGCDFETPVDELPLQFMDDFEIQLSDARVLMQEFSTNLTTVGLPQLTELLKTDAEELKARLDSFVGDTDSMIALIDEIVSRLACERFYEIYSKVVHDATCDKSYKGVTWVMVSFIVIGFSGCMMLMFRSVLYPVAGQDEQDFSWNDAIERDEQKEVAPLGEDEYTKNYVQDEAIPDKSGAMTAEEETPMGGQSKLSAQQSYESVGDSNPFAEDENNQTFIPRKSSFE